MDPSLIVSIEEIEQSPCFIQPLSLNHISIPNLHIAWHWGFFFKDFIYLFLDRRERREKERDRNINMWLLLMHLLLGTWPATQACALTGNQTGDPLVCRPALNSLNHTSQGCLALFIHVFPTRSCASFIIAFLVPSTVPGTQQALKACLIGTMMQKRLGQYQDSIFPPITSKT